MLIKSSSDKEKNDSIEGKQEESSEDELTVSKIEISFIFR